MNFHANLFSNSKASGQFLSYLSVFFCGFKRHLASVRELIDLNFPIQPATFQSRFIPSLNALVFFSLSHSRCVELIICEQMNKYRVRLKDINSLEFAESKAKSRLTLIRRSMVKFKLAAGFAVHFLPLLSSFFFPLQNLPANLFFPLPRNPH